MISLHNHSTYSSAGLGFSDSVISVESMIQYAYDIGLDGISLTDHELISGHLDAENYYNSMKLDRPFKLMRGNEIYLMDEQEDYNNKNDTASTSFTPYYHFLLNALDAEGHRQIRMLSSCAWYRSYFSRGINRRPTYYSDFEKCGITKNKGHLVASSACLGGFLPRAIQKWKSGDESVKREIHKFITWCIDVFGKDKFFLEVQPCLKDNAEQRLVNKAMLELSKAYGIGIIPTTDAHYLNKENRFIHETLLKANSKNGTDRQEYYDTAYIMSSDELRDYLRIDFTDEQIDDFFNNTLKIGEMAQEYSLKQVSDVPLIPEDKLGEVNPTHYFHMHYEKYKNIKHYATTKDVFDLHFWQQVEKGLMDKVVNNPNRTATIEQYLERIDAEFADLILLSDALNTRMACYYSTVQKVVDLIYEVDSLVGSGRGSAGAWCTAYLLDITQCDSVEVPELQFHQRHLSAGRKQELPDCDIDVCANKRQAIIDIITRFWGQEHVVSVATFTKLSSKTSIDKAVKGLGINEDVAGFLKSIIPIERMKMWTARECLEGNEKKGMKPVVEFVNEVDKYPRLRECILAFEGMIVGRGSHAGGVIICNKNLTEYNAYMRAPSGLLTTQFELHQSEAVGLVKFDLLSLSALDKIKTTMNLLLEYGYWEDKGSLRKNFNHYLNPDVINYDNEKMWDNIAIYKSLFQYETPMGIRAISMINPRDIHQLTVANSIMRLKGEKGQETPMEKFVRYKNDINEWYNDMKVFGLNQNEINVLENYLSSSFGVCESQEKLIKLTMDENVASFDLRESDQARKAVAKGSKDAMKETEERLYTYGAKLGVRKVFLDYLWNVQFEMQKAYAFSEIHSYEYSIIALQEMNLNHFYPRILWETAVLTIDSEADEEDENSGSTPYGKIATSICKLKLNGTNIQSPDINKSKYGYTPLIEENTILIGLRAIAGIGVDVVNDIINGRPYDSFKQFYEYHKNGIWKGEIDEDGNKIFERSSVTKSKIIMLIKAGCFDFDNPNRIALMKWLACWETGAKENLTTANLPKCVELGVDLPQELLRPYRFKKYVCSKEFFYCKNAKAKSKKDYMLDSYARNYFEKNYINKLVEEKDYYYVDDNIIIVDKSLEKAMENEMNQLKEYLNKPEVVADFNKKSMIETYKNMIEVEDINKWAMESISFYDRNHELDYANLEDYDVVSFNSLSSEAEFELKRNGKREWRQYKLSRIAGTIIDCDHNKNILSLLTLDGVVNVRFNKGQYAHYKQNISEMVDGKKITLEKPFFARGNMIMVCGYRREDEFVAKKYARSLYQHTVCLIEKINSDGSLNLRLERYSTEEE